MAWLMILNWVAEGSVVGDLGDPAAMTLSLVGLDVVDWG